MSDLLTNAVSNLVLHTAGDGQTLVRTIVDLDFDDIVAATQRGEFLIELEPAGIAIESPGVGVSLDNPVPKQLIARVAFGVISGGSKHIHLDLKGQRKMVIGDELVLRHTGDQVNGCNITGGVLLMFKD